MSGLPAARQTDKTLKGGPIVQGSLTVLIGSQGGKACSVCPGGKTNTPDPVNPQLGAKVLLGPEDLDFALPGALPVIWQRQYSSYVNSEHGAACGLLGHGWHLLTELSIEPKASSLLLFDASGRVITFGEALQSAGQNYSASEDLWLIRGGQTSEGQPPEWTRHKRFAHVNDDLAQDPNVLIAASGSVDILWLFTPTAGSRWRLTAQIDRFGRRQSYRYSTGKEEIKIPEAKRNLFARSTDVLPEGKLIAITDGAGRRYRLEHQRIHAGKPVQGPWGADDGWRLASVELERDPLHTLPEPILLVSYGYSSQGDLITVHNRAGELTREYKWQEHRIIAHRHRSGPWHTYRYADTPLGLRVVEHGNEEGLGYRFDYRKEEPSPEGQPRHSAQVTDSLSRSDHYLFEGEAGLSRLIEHHRADGSVLRYSYDGHGRLSASTGPQGRTTYIRRDAQGNILGVQLPDGSASSQDYDEAGHLTQSRDSAGVVTSYNYDEHSRLSEIKHDASGSEHYRYLDPRQEPLTCDRPAEIQDAKGGVKKLQWNKAGLLISHTDCSGKTTHWDYDRWGQTIKVTDAQNQVTRYERDGQGRIKAAHRPNRQVERYHYDARDNLIRIEPPTDNNNQTPSSPIELTYDLWGRLIKRKHGALSVQLAYDIAGRLTQLTNENAAKSHFKWDPMGRLIEKTGFDGRIQRYQWDQSGQLVQASDGQGQNWQESQYRWDALGHLAERTLAATQATPSQSHCYEWDAAERLKTISVYTGPEQLQSRIELQRDSAGRLTGEAQKLYKPEPSATPQVEFEHHIAHQFDELGNRTQSQLQAAGNIQWLLYGSGHVHGLMHEQHSLIDFERDDLHRETNRQWRSSSEQTFSQSRWRDQLGRLQGIDLQGLPAQQSVPQVFIGQISQRRYHYDALGQIIGIQSTVDVQRFGYDAAGRLRARASSLNPNETQHWNIDAAGNRLPGQTPSKQEQQDNWAELVRKHGRDPGFNLLGYGSLPILEKGPIEQWKNNRIGYHEGNGNDSNGSVLRYDAHGNRIEQFTELKGGHYTKQTLSYDGAHQLAL
ncbi:MAG: DUF6531 domain-containing protein, partial [Desulfovibrionaceae bacterium]|nr:DUF6531 domain-containing protein [Desulfovibrionaceae bacterium]